MVRGLAEQLLTRRGSSTTRARSGNGGLARNGSTHRGLEGRGASHGICDCADESVVPGQEVRARRPQEREVWTLIELDEAGRGREVDDGPVGLKARDLGEQGRERARPEGDQIEGDVVFEHHKDLGVCFLEISVHSCGTSLKWE